MPNSLNDRSQSRSQFRRAAIENLEGRRLFAADGMILADVQPPAAEGLLLPAVQKLVGDGSINDSGNKGRDVADGHAKDISLPVWARTHSGPPWAMSSSSSSSSIESAVNCRRRRRTMILGAAHV